MKKTRIGQELFSNKTENPAFMNIELEKQINAVYDLLCQIYGTEKVVLKANKLEALSQIRSPHLGERVLGLQKLVFEDPTIDEILVEDEIPDALAELEEVIADYVAGQALEDRLERLIGDRMQERHEEYYREIKMQLLRELGCVESPQTLKKLNRLEEMEKVQLASPVMEILRPKNFKEIKGQEQAITALMAKLVSPFPQHMILYGPPGVGKTTAARLALEAAKKFKLSSFAKNAPFIEVDGTTLRWDPREITNPLLGSVHDPIYQGARKDLADTGIPEPKLGLVSDAHGGILFIDEIGEMDPQLLNKLLKVLEDKRVQFESSYFDPEDEQIPGYIKKIFAQGVPADFVLIGATTRDPSTINPALRSRSVEIYFEPLTPEDIQAIVISAGKKLKVKLDKDVPALISDYTIEGRKANNILADAYGLALYQKAGASNGGKVKITKEHIYQVVQNSRLSPYITQRATNMGETGRIFGLGVYGFVGSLIEIEAMALPAGEKGKGKIRFNDTAGSMAKDSVFNGVALVRKVMGVELEDYDLHVNVIGGGNIDGPSAGTAITLAILSAVSGQKIRQDVAVTGEISLQGKLKPVGGIVEKIYGAKQAGIKKILVPKDNLKDVPLNIQGIEVKGVEDIQAALEESVFIEGTKGDG